MDAVEMSNATAKAETAIDSPSSASSSSNSEKAIEMGEAPTKRKYPKQVILIILIEFSGFVVWRGVSTVLYVYLTSFIGLDKNTATLINHAQTAFCYLTTIIGIINI